MFVLNLGIGWVEHPKGWGARSEQGLAYVRGPMLIRGIQPPRVILRNRLHARNIAAEAGLQIHVADLRLDQVFHEVFRYCRVLCPFRDQTERIRNLSWYRLTV